MTGTQGMGGLVQSTGNPAGQGAWFLPPKPSKWQGRRDRELGDQDTENGAPTRVLGKNSNCKETFM